MELGCRGCQVVQARYYSVCWYSQHEWDRATVLRQSDILEPCIALSGHVPEAAQGLSRAEGGGDPSRWVMLETSPLTTPTCGGYAEFMPEESKLQTQHATTPWLAAGCDALLSNPWDPQHSRSELANSLPYRPSHVIRPRSSPWFLRGGQRIGHLGMGSFSGEVPRVSVQASPAPVSIPCMVQMYRSPLDEGGTATKITMVYTSDPPQNLSRSSRSALELTLASWRLGNLPQLASGIGRWPEGACEERRP